MAFELLLLLLLGSAVFALTTGLLPNVPERAKLPFLCMLVAGVGGVVYCLRGVYISACVRGRWDDAWQPWYYIRPFVSASCGAVSWLFLKAGLLILDATTSSDSSDLGFYALAFISGLNVDKFISKIEDIAQATWGIEKSRVSKSENP